MSRGRRGLDNCKIRARRRDYQPQPRSCPPPACSFFVLKPRSDIRDRNSRRSSQNRPPEMPSRGNRYAIGCGNFHGGVEHATLLNPPPNEVTVPSVGVARAHDNLGRPNPIRKYAANPSSDQFKIPGNSGMSRRSRKSRSTLVSGIKCVKGRRCIRRQIPIPEPRTIGL